MRRKAPVFAGLFVLLVLFAAFAAKAAAGAPLNRLAAREFALNERVEATSTGLAAFVVRPGASGAYVLYAFQETDVEAEVRVDGEVVASGVTPLMFDMRSGVSYEIRARGEGAYTLEVMRNALGRSVTNPLVLSPQGALKRSVTRAYDVHWYLYTAAEEGAHVIRVTPALNGGVNAACDVFDESGVPTGEKYAMQDGFLAFVSLKKGQSCLVRVCGSGNDTGNYTVSVEPKTNRRVPTSIGLSTQTLALRTGEFSRVTAYLSPNGAIADVAWISGDARVATVSAQGDVAAVGVGACTIYAYAYGELRAALRVTVSQPTITGVRFSYDTLTLAQGDGFYLSWNVTPHAVTEYEATFSVSDENVASVSTDGFLDALTPGEATVTITLAEGGFSSELLLTVTEPKPIYRALLVGVAGYDDGRARMGCVNTTQGMLDALSNANMNGAMYLTNMQLDITKEELASAIQTTFQDALDTDISLFYINCHGGVTANVAWLEMRDGGKVSAMELEQMLSRIKGRVVVILDFCNSGAFIGQAGMPDTFTTGMINAFANAGGGGAFASSKYKVLVSSSYDQNSYRVAGASSITESSMSTAFARALAEGLGWDMIKDKSTSLKADLDKNLKITLQEAYVYAYKRTLYYIKGSSARQSVQVWPRGDAFTLVAR